MQETKAMAAVESFFIFVHTADPRIIRGKKCNFQIIKEACNLINKEPPLNPCQHRIFAEEFFSAWAKTEPDVGFIEGIAEFLGIPWQLNKNGQRQAA